MASTKTGFDKWAEKKLASPRFEKQYRDARKHVEAVDALVACLDDVRARSGVSKAELARSIDTKPEVVRRLFTKKGANPTLSTVVEIAAALGLELQFVPVAQQRQVGKARPRITKSTESRDVA